MRHISLHQFIDKCIHIGCVLGHTALEHIVGISVIAKQLCYLTLQIDDAAHCLAVVMLAALAADGVLGRIYLAAQLAVVGIGHKGTIAGLVECEEPSCQLLLAGSQCCCLNGRIGQTSQLCLIGHVQAVGIGFLQAVLAELKGQSREFHTQAGELLLVLIAQAGTSALESVEGIVQHLLLFGSESGSMFLDVADAFEELLVEQNLVGMLGEQRRELLRQAVGIIRGAAAQQIEEYGGGAIEQFVSRRQDGVLEGRFFGILRYLLDGSFLLSHSLHDGLFIVGQCDLVKGCGIVRCSVLSAEEWILSFCVCHALCMFVVVCVLYLIYNMRARVKRLPDPHSGAALWLPMCSRSVRREGMLMQEREMLMACWPANALSIRDTVRRVSSM